MKVPEILSADLPLATALRAAADRKQILQTNGRVSLLAPKLLPGFAKIVGGGTRNETPREAA